MIWNRYALDSDLELEGFREIGERLRDLHRGVGGAKIMPNYDRDYGKAGCWEGMYWTRWYDFPMAVLSTDPQPNMRVLDVGCGCSPFLLYLKELGCECYGVDPSEGMITASQGFPPDVPELRDAFSGIEFKRAGMEEIPYPDNYFDRVYNISVLEHLMSWPHIIKKGLREMSRVLKKGGLLCIIVDSSAWPSVAFIKDAKSIGLDFYGEADYTRPDEGSWNTKDPFAKGCKDRDVESFLDGSELYFNIVYFLLVK